MIANTVNNRFVSAFVCLTGVLTIHLFLTVYHCGSDLGWSNEFWFKTAPPDEVWQPSLAIYGDMGNENAQSLARLQVETQRGLYNAVLHVGDFAYDMDSVS